MPPGYQLRVAAVGGDESRGSVFTDVSVPRFDAEVAVGGLSLGAASSAAVTQADRLRGVLTLVPLATNEMAPGASLAVQLPIRVSPKAASSALTITTTLERADGTTLTLDRIEASGRDYGGGGKIHRVTIPPALSAGSYRVRIDCAIGRRTITRELAFSVSGR